MRRRALLATIAGGSVGLAGCSSLGSTSSPATVTPTATIPVCDETPIGTWTLLVPSSTSTAADDEAPSALQNATDRLNTKLQAFHYLKGALQTNEGYDGTEVERLLRDADERSSTASSTHSDETVQFLQHVSASLDAISTANESLHRQVTLDPGRNIPKLNEAISFMEAAKPAIEAARSKAEEARSVAEGIPTPDDDADSPRKTHVRLAYLDRIVSGYEWYVRAEIPHYEGLISNLKGVESYDNGDTEEAREAAREAVGQFIASKDGYCAGIEVASHYTGRWFARMVCEADRRARYQTQMELAYTYDLQGNADRQRQAAKRGMEIAEENC